ncbi:hypothetical protein FRC09_008693 [Ceratobasidium sp. 395]|nr:hypothetical protein FRC09_008693 [Ceratobasidium sp. 395]
MLSSRVANATSMGIASSRTDLDDATTQIEILRKIGKELRVRDKETSVRLQNLEKILMSLIGVKAPDSPSAETPGYALAPISWSSKHPAPIPGPSEHSTPVAGSVVPKADPLDGESSKKWMRR